MMDKILGFKNGYRWLSNFWPSPIVDENHLTWKTVEHYYQACKATTEEDRELIRNSPKPGDAKRLGKKIKLREDWEQVKLKIMYHCVKLKFAQNEDLKQKLLETGNAYLEETNYWGDVCFGVCNGVGENYLGKILMQVRHELRTAPPTLLINNR